MKAISHPYANVNFAENQDEYTTLPAYKSESGLVVAAFKLEEDELEQVKETGIIFLSLHTFNMPLQPIGMSLLNPFPKALIESESGALEYSNEEEE
jgi:hypothetical protein